MSDDTPPYGESARVRRDTKHTKVQLRLRNAQKDVIARAARLKRSSVTAFMVEHAYNAAQQVLADQTHFELDPARWRAFTEALEAPPGRVEALRELFERRDVFED